MKVPPAYKVITRRPNVDKVTWETYAFLSKNTNYTIAVAARDTQQTLDPTNEAHKQLISISRFQAEDDIRPYYSSPAIFPEIGIIGDSYSLGSMHWGTDGYQGYPELSWGKLMCKRNGNSCTLYSHGGYGIKRWLNEIYPTLITDTPKQLYWWGLGINDADNAHTSPTNLGSLADIESGDYTQYPDTLYGNYAKAYEMVHAFAPLAKHVFVSCIGATPNHRYYYYKEINTMLQELAGHYGVPFIDLVDDIFYTSKYYVDQVHGNHPTLIGYGGMSYANERLLNRCIADNVAYFIDYGRTS